MTDHLKELYKTIILKHDRAPFHYEKKENAMHVIKAYNEICGDRFELFLEINNGIISDAHFHGFGCAISKASTSVLIKKIINRPIREVCQLIELFLGNIIGEKNTTEIADEELTAFFAAKEFPGRKKCATLGWEELGKFIIEDL